MHRETLARARMMMSSDQLKAFDVSQEPAQLRAEYGDSAFGRGCLAARRLIEVGVRCVEVTLDGWDSHVNNHAIQAARVKMLDPAFAALLRDLKRRDLFDRTVVLCCGEFGRTPKMNLTGRPRPLDERLQHRAGRWRPARRARHRRDRSRSGQGPGPADVGRGRARDGAQGTGLEPGQGEHRTGDQPADQAEPGAGDCGADRLSGPLAARFSDGQQGF